MFAGKAQNSHVWPVGTVEGRNPVNQLRLAASIISHLYWLVLGDEQGAKDTN